MLSGPRGAGKTTVAERIPTILPDLTLEQSLEVTALHSLVGALDSLVSCAARRFPAPPRRAAAPASSAAAPVARARRGQPGPPRRAVPRRVPAVPRRRHRRAAPAAGGGGGVDRPRARSRATYPARGWWCSRPTRARAATSTAGGDACDCLETSAPHYQRKLRARSSTGSTSGASCARRGTAAARPVRPPGVLRGAPGARRGGAAATGRALRRPGGSQLRRARARCWRSGGR